MPVFSSAKPFVRALGRKRVHGEVAELSVVVQRSMNYLAGLLSLRLFCLAMREYMQYALANSYTEYQRSDSSYFYTVFMIHDIRSHEQEFCVLIKWHAVDVNLWHCLIKNKDFKIKEGCAIDLDVDNFCSEILFSWFLQYKWIMKSCHSNPLLVNMHRSDEKCGGSFVCESSSMLCFCLFISCTLMVVLFAF